MRFWVPLLLSIAVLSNFSIRKFFPFMRWGQNLDEETVRADLLAGLTGAAIVLPQGVAFATIAGMPPEYGLYASIVPAIIAALFGSSWHLVSGPTTAASIVMFSSLSGLAEPGSEEYISLAITLAFMVGITQFAMGVIRLGALVNFISHSVIVGFTCGAALLIASKQVKIFLGLDIPESKHFYESVVYLFGHWSAFHPMVTLVGFSSLISVVVVRKKWTKFPGMVAALFVGSLVAAILNLIFGADRSGIDMVGALPRQLPPLSMPDFSAKAFQDLAPLALAMTLFALTEAVSIARAIALKSGQTIQGNQEFIGQGLSNIVGSLFSSYVATGSFNRSGANYEAGARSPLSAVFAGLLLIPLLMVVAPLTAYLPKAAVAGLLILIAWDIINFTEIKKIFSADKREAAILGVTFLSTIFFKLEFAILFGVMLALFLYLRKTSRPLIISRVPNPESKHRKFGSGGPLLECPQLKILRLDDSIYFGSVAHIGEMLRLYREHYPQQKQLLLLTKGVNQVDVGGAELLMAETKERRKIGGDLYLYRLKDSASQVLKNGGYLDFIGEDHIFDSKEDAISSIFERLDRDICSTCENRIFRECHMLNQHNLIDVEANDQQADETTLSPRVTKKSTKKVRNITLKSSKKENQENP